MAVLDLILRIAWPVLALFFALGAVFALAFVSRGAGRVDADARGATLGFRVAIFPGCVALWPWLLGRWLAAKRRGGDLSSEGRQT